MATYLVSARGTTGGVGIFVGSTGEAVRKSRELQAAGLRVLILDARGRQRDLSELENESGMNAYWTTLEELPSTNLPNAEPIAGLPSETALSAMEGVPVANVYLCISRQPDRQQAAARPSDTDRASVQA